MRLGKLKSISVSVALGISWLLLVVLKRPAADGYHPLQLCILGLQLTAIVLVAWRHPPLDEVRPQAIMPVVPSIVLAGVMLRLAPQPSEWMLAAILVLGVGTVLAIWSLVVLGSSFGLMPARRQLVRSGPYAIVRHPAYLGELMMCLSCLLALAGSPDHRMDKLAIATFVFAAIVVAVHWRIDEEESVMSASPDWCRYVEATPNRLIPRVVHQGKRGGATVIERSLSGRRER